MKKRAAAPNGERRLSFLREAQFSGVAAPGQMIRDANGEICSLLLRRIFQISAGQMGIVQIQHAETVQIAGLPWLGSAAEVQNGSVIHYPVRVIAAGTGHSVGIIISRVIVPYSVLQRQNPVAIKCVEEILVWEHHLFFVFGHKLKQVFR